jgi:hypothetical protein
MLEEAGDTSTPSLVEVWYTVNFEANLQSIEAFWIENKFAQGYDYLLDALIGTVVPNLERHPRMGRPFMARQPGSIEAKKQYARLQAKMAAHAQPADMREYLMTDYLVLYTLLDATHDRLAKIYLVSIKHHKQLSFDFERLWL